MSVPVGNYRSGDRLISSHIRLEDINLGFEKLAPDEAVRQIIGFEP